MKEIAKRNATQYNTKGYSKLRKDVLQTLLRNRLPLEVYDEEIIRPNREEFIRRLIGSGGNYNRNRNNNRSLLDSDNP